MDGVLAGEIAAGKRSDAAQGNGAISIPKKQVGGGSADAGSP